jgi:hypothetical protein
MIVIVSAHFSHNQNHSASRPRPWKSLACVIAIGEGAKAKSLPPRKYRNLVVQDGFAHLVTISSPFGCFYVLLSSSSRGLYAALPHELGDYDRSPRRTRIVKVCLVNGVHPLEGRGIGKVKLARSRRLRPTFSLL